MKSLSLMILTAMFLLACNEQQGTWEARMPYALDRLAPSASDSAGITTYFDEHSQSLTGTYLYPFIIKQANDIHLYIHFYNSYPKGEERLAIEAYVVDVGDQVYRVEPDPEAGESIGLERSKDGYAETFGRLATPDDIMMLKGVALAPETIIYYETEREESRKVVSEQERRIILTILSAYEQMGGKLEDD